MNFETQIENKRNFFFSGCGQTGDLFRSIDWSRHPLGTPDTWPTELRVTLNILFHSKHPMFLWWGPELYQFYNDAYMPSFGLGKHPKAMGQKGAECWPETWPIIKPQIDLVMSGRGATWNENQLVPIFRNGRMEDVYWTYGYSPVYLESGEIGGTLVVCTETTPQVAAIEEARQAKEAAERADQSKSAFLAHMSHEIRTPLGAILGFADVLQSPDIEAKERSEYLNIITRNGHALIKIIDDILDLSKIEAGKLEIERIPICLLDLTRDILAMFSDRAAGKGLYLRLKEENFPNFKVDSDPVRIRQVLVNLIGNAIKFTSQGGVTVDASYEDLDAKFIRMCFVVSDTGIGMEPDQAAKLFSPFTQGDSKNSRRYGGTGLGLALSKKMGLALGGDVRLKSFALGQGASFELEIVAARSATTERTLTAHAAAAGTTLKNRLADIKILVVDDAADNRTLIEKLLLREGASVDLAPGGEVACQIVQQKEYDIVLLDIQMPVMDGYGTLQKLRSEKFTKPILALTAHAMKEERTRALAAGFCDHIAKPIHPKDLIDAVLAHVRKD